MSNNPILQYQVAIVTGAGQGIGYEICRRLREQGAKIVLNDVDFGSTKFHLISNANIIQ